MVKICARISGWDIGCSVYYIRVKTKDELVQRIYRYFDEVNEQPVVYHWKYKLEEINSSEEVVVDTLPIQKSS